MLPTWTGGSWTLTKSTDFKWDKVGGDVICLMHTTGPLIRRGKWFYHMNAKISLPCVKWWWEITLSKMQNGWVHGPQQQNARLRPGNLAEWGQTRASGGQILSIIEIWAVVFLRLMDTDSQQNHGFNFQRHIKEILLQLENEWKSNSTHRHGLLLCPGGRYDDSTKKKHTI